MVPYSGKKLQTCENTPPLIKMFRVLWLESRPVIYTLVYNIYKTSLFSEFISSKNRGVKCIFFYDAVLGLLKPE